MHWLPCTWELPELLKSCGVNFMPVTPSAIFKLRKILIRSISIASAVHNNSNLWMWHSCQSVPYGFKFMEPPFQLTGLSNCNCWSYLGISDLISFLDITSLTHPNATRHLFKWDFKNMKQRKRPARKRVMKQNRRKEWVRTSLSLKYTISSVRETWLSVHCCNWSWSSRWACQCSCCVAAQSN